MGRNNQAHTRKHQPQRVPGPQDVLGVRRTRRHHASANHRPRPLYDPRSQQGRWSEQEVKVLEEQYARFGPVWTEVSVVVGRTPQDCWTKWVSLVDAKARTNHGVLWTIEEMEKLKGIVGAIGTSS